MIYFDRKKSILQTLSPAPKGRGHPNISTHFKPKILLYFAHENVQSPSQFYLEETALQICHSKRFDASKLKIELDAVPSYDPTH